MPLHGCTFLAWTLSRMACLLVNCLACCFLPSERSYQLQGCAAHICPASVLMSSSHRQDITVGNPAKAQLARAVRNPEEAFNTMRGSFFVVETKFDGGLLLLIAPAPATLESPHQDSETMSKELRNRQLGRPVSSPVL